MSAQSTNEIEERFSFHPATEETGPAHESVRAALRTTAHFLDGLLPDSREKSTAITKLQEAMMHANAAIAIHGVKREES